MTAVRPPSQAEIERIRAAYGVKGSIAPVMVCPPRTHALNPANGLSWKQKRTRQFAENMRKKRVMAANAAERAPAEPKPLRLAQPVQTQPAAAKPPRKPAPAPKIAKPSRKKKSRATGAKERIAAEYAARVEQVRELAADPLLAKREIADRVGMSPSALGKLLRRERIECAAAHILHPARDRLIIRLCKAGATVREICAETGMTRGGVDRACKRLRVKPAPSHALCDYATKQNGRARDTQFDARIAELCAEGVHRAEIARRLGLTRDRVSFIVGVLGIEAAAHPKGPK